MRTRNHIILQNILVDLLALFTFSSSFAYNHTEKIMFFVINKNARIHMEKKRTQTYSCGEKS